MRKDAGGIQPTTNFSKIPNELTHFLKRNTYSLLIKGAAGTGKTTLALTILKELKIKNYLFISTRISPEQLFQYYPWLEEFLGEAKKAHITENTDLSSDFPVFVDARLDEPASLFERITNELMDAKAPMIIIDTWDAIGYLMDKEALLTNARVLETWRQRAGAKLVLISENTQDTMFDFLLDGIVLLEHKYHDDRKIREISFSKLRGVSVNRFSYFFTLNNSLFRSFDPYSLADFSLSPRRKSGEGHIEKSATPSTGQLISTGYNELDDLLGGGIPKKSIVIVELDSKVNPKVALVFLGKIISNFAASNNLVLFEAFKGIDPAHIARYLELDMSVSPHVKYVKGLWPVSNATEDRSLLQGSQKNKVQLAAFQKTVTEARKEYPSKLLLNIMSSDTIQQFQNKGTSSELESFLNFIRSNIDLSIIVTWSLQDTVRELISKVSEIRLRISEIKGTLFLQPEDPWSNLYAIVLEKQAGQPSIRLEPIV